jgi:hypothetical protein
VLGETGKSPPNWSRSRIGDLGTISAKPAIGRLRVDGRRAALFSSFSKDQGKASTTSRRAGAHGGYGQAGVDGLRCKARQYVGETEDVDEARFCELVPNAPSCRGVALQFLLYESWPHVETQTTQAAQKTLTFARCAFRVSCVFSLTRGNPNVSAMPQKRASFSTLIHSLGGAGTRR